MASQEPHEQLHDWSGAECSRCAESFLGETAMGNHLATVHHVNRTLLVGGHQAAGPSDKTPVKPTKRDVAAMAKAGTLERQARLLSALATHLGAPSRDVQPRPAPSALPAESSAPPPVSRFRPLTHSLPPARPAPSSAAPTASSSRFLTDPARYISPTPPYPYPIGPFAAEYTPLIDPMAPYHVAPIGHGASALPPSPSISESFPRLESNSGAVLGGDAAANSQQAFARYHDGLHAFNTVSPAYFSASQQEAKDRGDGYNELYNLSDDDAKSRKRKRPSDGNGAKRKRKRDE
ncbi:hypothetical protein LTR91_006014 [Friedmanniomyces endolithicus]|uniref:C2H2-type domain-containing protein n=1 Tax=Friedmanniomyces endolithicus TaxID=329885 RepID=A0AAN6QWB9_9PEZI|nr:hypothetical protein LTR91_006014 [Friedmanniomyces endolithicus]